MRRLHLLVILSLSASTAGALGACESSSGAGSEPDAVADAADAIAGHDHGGDAADPVHEALADACTHFQIGPFVPAPAGASADASAPVLEPAHQLNEVTLAEVTGGHGGSFRLVADGDGDVLLALSDPLAVELRDAAGDVVTPEQSLDPSPHCAAIAAARVYHLHAATYFLTLGPSQTLTAVQLLVIEVGGEHRHG